MQFVRKTRPNLTCIAVTDVRENERISHDKEATLIGRHIKAAEAYLEKRTGRAIMRQTYELRTTRLDPGFALYYPPMEGDVIVKTAQTLVGGTSTDLVVQDLRMSLERGLPFVRFPTIGAIAAGALTITYDTGAATVDEVPPDVQQAVLLLASHFYRAREAVQTDGRVMDIDKKVAFGVDELMSPYMIRNINIPFYTEAN